MKFGSKKVITIAVIGYVIMMFCTLYSMKNQSILFVSICFYCSINNVFRRKY